MTRNIPTTVETAISANHGYSYVVACELDFESGIVRFHSGSGTIRTPDGREWLGVGRLGMAAAVQENAELAAPRLHLSISGIDSGQVSSNVSSVLQEDLRNRAAKQLLIFINGAGVALEPMVLFKGRLDNVTIRQGKSFSIGVSVETVMARWSSASELRYTAEQQKAQFPSDQGLDFVPQMVERELHWGRTS